MYDLVYNISIQCSKLVILVLCSLTIIPYTEVSSVSVLLCPSIDVPVLGLNEYLPPILQYISPLFPPNLPIETPAILTLGVPLETIEVLNGLVNLISDPDHIIGQYIDEPIEDITIISQHQYVCVTINNGTTYLFNMLNGRLLREYKPGDFEGANWVEDGEQLMF